MEELISEHGNSLISAVMGILFIGITMLIVKVLMEAQIIELEQLI